MSLQERYELGQFIPLHYHFQMLADEVRMAAIQGALTAVIPMGGSVLELGSGTGVLSFFAAQRARHVLAVEYNPQLVNASRRLLSDNGVADRVTVVQGDAADFTPTDPVDVVICEMLHSALLREKQLQVIGRFKANYLARFAVLPRFVPEATRRTRRIARRGGGDSPQNEVGVSMNRLSAAQHERYSNANDRQNSNCLESIQLRNESFDTSTEQVAHSRNQGRPNGRTDDVERGKAPGQNLSTANDDGSENAHAVHEADTDDQWRIEANEHGADARHARIRTRQLGQKRLASKAA